MRKLDKLLYIFIIGISALSIWIDCEPTACRSQYAHYIGGWKPMYSAPKDGSVIELLNVRGILPEHSLNEWNPELQGWADVGQPAMFFDSAAAGCLYWREHQSDPK